MKITGRDIEMVKRELLEKRKELDSLNLPSLEEKLKWIRNFFNKYVPELEARYLSNEELKDWTFLPDELRLQFYLVFPEHGLNMANYSQDLAHELYKKNSKRQYDVISRFYFCSHHD